MGWVTRALALWCIFVCSTRAATLVVHIQSPEGSAGSQSHYFVDLLKLALTETVDSDGAYEVAFCKLPLFLQDRRFWFLRREQQIDLCWTAASAQREKELLLIPIPLLKGLAGYQVLLINAADQPRFDGIQTLAQLRALTAGAGQDGTDHSTLELNGLPTELGRSSDGLFEMLRKHRFDYLPRSINDAWQEMEAHRRSGLAVEKHLLLYYTADIFFFVNKASAPLASRVERGLRKAIVDGSFERLFRERNQAALDLAGLAQRTVIKLENPALPADIPVGIKGLWMEPPR